MDSYSLQTLKPHIQPQYNLAGEETQTSIIQYKRTASILLKIQNK